jgi:hypothetical protein
VSHGPPPPAPRPGAPAPAIFIFDTEDGTISAWNPVVDPIVNGQSTATLVVDNSGAGAVYKALAFGTNKHGTFLFNDNDFLGPLHDANGKPISIDELWSIVFGTFLNSDADTLYSRPGRTSRRTVCSVRSWRSRAMTTISTR